MIWDKFDSSINLKIPTLGGKYLWTDIYLLAGWRIQKNILTDHFRLLDDKDKRRFSGSYKHCLTKLDHYKSELGLKFSNSHIVLLLHGLGRHKNTMSNPAEFLRKNGFEAYCLNYSSTFQSVDSHADDFEHLLNNLDGVTSISFIGHSLGGLIARELISRTEGWRKKIKVRHLIMLGTPNNGARIADMMSNMKLFHTIAGPSGQDIRSFNMLGLNCPDIPTLVIAGGRGTRTGFNPLLDEDNDGIVTVSETKLDHMTEFKLVNVIHTVIMDHPESLQAILDFLRKY